MANIEAWQIWKRVILDGEAKILTRAQVESEKPISKNSNGVDCYRVYRVECMSCDFIGRTRKFYDALQESLTHNNANSHVSNIRAGVFPLSKIGEKN